MTLRFSTNRVKRLSLVKEQEALLLGSFVVLPHASYLGLVGAGIVLLHWLAVYPQEIWHRLRRQGWVWLMVAMGISVLLAEHPAQAALKSTNFWPFFIFFAGLSVYLSRLSHPISYLRQLAFWLLVTSIPINLLAFLEYWPTLATNLGLAPWLLGQAPVHPRVAAVFGNPNVLAAYLVIIFGLGLGLCLQAFQATSTTPKTRLDSRCLLFPIGWLYTAVALIPLGVFCSGSRNGILVILVQLLIAIALIRKHRWAVGLSLGGMALILSGIIYWGVGGRSLMQALTSSSVRADIWQLSLPLIRQHPWFGVGFGGFQANYEPGSIANIDLLHHVHNLWLHLAAEAGLPVMILLTVIVGRICYRAVRYYQLGQLPPSAQGIVMSYGLGFLACTLFSVSDITLFDARINVLAWAMIAALQAISDGASRPRAAQSSEPIGL